VSGVHKFKIVNRFVAPQGHFFGKAGAVPQGAKLINIPDIHCVSRLALNDFSDLYFTKERRGVLIMSWEDNQWIN
jgi:hypothetical protein